MIKEILRSKRLYNKQEITFPIPLFKIVHDHYENFIEALEKKGKNKIDTNSSLQSQSLRVIQAIVYFIILSRAVVVIFTGNIDYLPYQFNQFPVLTLALLFFTYIGFSAFLVRILSMIVLWYFLSTQKKIEIFSATLFFPYDRYYKPSWFLLFIFISEYPYWFIISSFLGWKPVDLMAELVHYPDNKKINSKENSLKRVNPNQKEPEPALWEIASNWENPLNENGNVKDALVEALAMEQNINGVKRKLNWYKVGDKKKEIPLGASPETIRRKLNRNKTKWYNKK